MSATGRRDHLIAAGLGIATLLTRLPIVTAYPWEWDSILYMRALEQGFHVSDVLALSRPHPPGYIFYIGAATLARAVLMQPNAALVAVSVIASGIAVALLYFLCVRIADRTFAALSATALMTSPLFWLNGEVAMPYTVLAALSVVLALAFLVARHRGPRAAAWASLGFGLAAGARQDLLLFLAPLWLWSLSAVPARARWVAIAALGVGCLTWLVPSAVLSDGPVAYFEGVARQVMSVASASSPGTPATGGLAVVSISLLWGLGAVAPISLTLLISAGVGVVIRRDAAGAGAPLGTFFLLWIAPATLFYLLIHIGEWGYVLAVVPALLALTAWLAQMAAARGGRTARVTVAAALLVASLADAAVFLGALPGPFNAPALADHDRATAKRVSEVRRHDPGSTVVLAGSDLLIATDLLPGYTVLFSDDRASRTYERRLSQPTTVVIYEERAAPRGLDLTSAEHPGHGMSVVLVPAGSILTLNGRELDARARR